MPLRPGDVIGAYEVVSLLGQGGTATVYRAFHSRLNRHVAIKMIHPSYLEDKSFLVRFEREAQIVAGLEHPNIVPVYDFSEHEGEPYLVMKLIEGSTLKAMLNGGALRVEDSLGLMTPVAQALDYAHKQGVLHRDIKPSNIMLDRQMTPYLTDFGLARLALAGDSTISQDMLMGTPYYIAPEQALKNAKIDYRADLYSFGVVLYELLVGKVPFSTGTPYSIISDHVSEPLPLPSSLNPNVPPAVELVLLKALAKDPDDRYTSAAAMVDELAQSVQSNAPQITLLSNGRRSAAEVVAPQDAPQPEPTPPLPQAKPLPATKSRRRFWLWAGAILAIFSAVTITFVFGSVLRDVKQDRETATALAATAAAATPAPPSLDLYDVPVLSIEDARAAVQNNPNDPVSYLALARAQLAANDDAGARRTITQGLSIVPDVVRFEMTAASLATQIMRNDVAFIVYSDVLARAQGTDAYPAVRAVAGEYLYRAATAVDQLSLAQVIELNRELQNTSSPIVTAMIARAFLSNGNLRLAQSTIGKAMSQDHELAEAHLVNGEILRQQGNTERARAEWQLALNAEAPGWLRDRTHQLLDSLT